MILATTIMVVFSVLSNLLLKLDTRSFAQGQGIRRVGVAIGPRRGEAQYRAAPMARIAGIAHHVTQRGSQPSGFPSATTMSPSIATGSPSRAESSRQAWSQTENDVHGPAIRYLTRVNVIQLRPNSRLDPGVSRGCSAPVRIAKSIDGRLGCAFGDWPSRQRDGAPTPGAPSTPSRRACYGTFKSTLHTS